MKAPVLLTNREHRALFWALFSVGIGVMICSVLLVRLVHIQGRLVHLQGVNQSNDLQRKKDLHAFAVQEQAREDALRALIGRLQRDVTVHGGRAEPLPAELATTPTITIITRIVTPSGGPAPQKSPTPAPPSATPTPTPTPAPSPSCRVPALCWLGSGIPRVDPQVTGWDRGANGHGCGCAAGSGQPGGLRRGWWP